VLALEPTAVSEEVIGSLKSCFVEGDPEQQRRERKIRRRALVISIILQTVALAALVVFPLLGKSERVTYAPRILTPYAPGDPVKHNPGKPVPPNAGHQACMVCFNHNPAPTIKPGETVTTTLADPPGDFIPGAPSGPGVPGGLNLDSSSSGPECPGSAVRAEPSKPLKVTSLEPAMLAHRVEPLYPTLAKQTGREGRVELHALIATDGSIESLEVVSGDPLFYSSALAAVREWRYRPTYLNGQAVEIDTRITVVYKLNR
jgi:periplasmic protein TonB